VTNQRRAAPGTAELPLGIHCDGPPRDGPDESADTQPHLTADDRADPSLPSNYSRFVVSFASPPIPPPLNHLTASPPYPLHRPTRFTPLPNRLKKTKGY